MPVTERVHYKMHHDQHNIPDNIRWFHQLPIHELYKEEDIHYFACFQHQ